MKYLDELEFPHNEAQAHGAMIHMAGEICESGDYEKTLEILDEVRGQLVEKLMDKKDLENTIPCSPPFGGLMKPDYEHELDDYFKQ